MRTMIPAMVAVALVGASCGNMAEKDIEAEGASGVVLVQNQSYYEVTLSNGESIFFSGFDEENNMKGIALEEDSVKELTSYGTGFFISPHGEIATNAHVVANVTSERDVNRQMADVVDAIKKLVEEAYEAYNEKLAEAQRAYDYANQSPDVSYADFYKVKEIRDNIQSQMRSYAAYYENLSKIRPGDSRITYHNRVSIAFNNTFVTNSDDFKSCVVTKKDVDHDLAIIQIKDKVTPEGKYIFPVPDEDPLDEYTMGDNLTAKVSEDKNSRLYMTGFNLGPQLALTKEGIKSQFNNGTISQTQADKLMYSIPALRGSSGSPVVNKKGELVAVNYAGISSTQNFNYGIRVKFLRRLMAE